MALLERRHHPATLSSPGESYNEEEIRKDFPILHREINGKPLVYLDNAATTQKPMLVIDAIHDYYTKSNSNVHRGVHSLSQTATDMFEASREKAHKYFNTAVPCEIVFTRGTTEAINLVAQTYGKVHVHEGDEIIVSRMEHHSNILPWQLLCEEKGAHLKVIPINEQGEMILEEFEKLLNKRTKLVAVSHVSNALGTINPIKSIVKLAHDHNVPVLVDGAQSAPHLPVDVQDLNCDFYACSGHKMYGPTGIGMLYGKAALLDAMPPYQSGGDMILSVSFDKTVFNYIPHKFEAGTPHIEGVVGLSAAMDYISTLGRDRIFAHEQDLLAYATESLGQLDGLRMIGTAKEKVGVLSFTLDFAHPHDVGQILDEHGVAVRVGHHCAQPVMEFFKIPATTRASLGIYNTRQDIDALTDALKDVYRIFA